MAAACALLPLAAPCGEGSGVGVQRRRCVWPHPLQSSRTKSARLRIERGRPQRNVGAVAQGYGHPAGLALDLHVTEELHALRGREVLLALIGRFDELHFGTEGVVEFVRSERAGIERPGDEFPERLEILELRLVRIVIMRGRVVRVGRQPNRVGDSCGGY